MLKRCLTYCFMAWQVILLLAPNPVHAAKLFAVSSQGEESTNEVFRYEVGPTGAPTLDLTITHSSFDRPFGIAFNAAGEMFIVNRSSGGGAGGSVSRFLNVGISPLFNGTILSSSFNTPHGATFRMGELFIAQRFGDGVLRFLFDGAGNASFNGAITSGLTPGFPRGVTVNPTTGELFVTECCQGNKISRYIFDTSGNAVPNGVITAGGLSNPHALAFSPWGELFVANVDGGISRFVFDTSSNATSNGQLFGNGLCGPIGLAFSPWGELFVSSHFCPTISRWVFDTAFNAIPNGSFSTPATLGELGFLPVIEVQIDIKPGSFPNSINLGSNGVVPVAILSSATFDATTVNPTTVTLAGASIKLRGNGTPMAFSQDVNGDGRLDLVVQVSTEALQLSDGDTQAMLSGQTFDGTFIKGTDSVRVVP